MAGVGRQVGRGVGRQVGRSLVRSSSVLARYLPSLYKLPGVVIAHHAVTSPNVDGAVQAFSNINGPGTAFSQMVSGAKPTRGGGKITFDGSADYLESINAHGTYPNAQSAATLVFLGCTLRASIPATAECLGGWFGPNSADFCDATQSVTTGRLTSRRRVSTGSAIAHVSTAAVTDGSRSMYSISLDAGGTPSIRSHKNGVATAADASGTVPTGSGLEYLTIGANRQAAAANFSTMSFEAIVVLPTAVTAQQLAELLAWHTAGCPIGGSDLTMSPDYVIAAIGDSLTYNTTDGRLPDFYPAQLRDLITASGKTTQSRNHGVSGNTTTQMLARVSNLLKYEVPEVAIIYGGTNDTGANPTTQNIVDIATSLYTAGTRRFVVLGYHYLNWTAGGDTVGTPKADSAAIRALQAAAVAPIDALLGAECLYVDLWAVMAARITVGTDTQGSYSWHRSDSNVHLNPYGEAIVGQALYDAMLSAGWIAEIP